VFLFFIETERIFFGVENIIYDNIAKTVCYFRTDGLGRVYQKQKKISDKQPPSDDRSCCHVRSIAFSSIAFYHYCAKKEYDEKKIIHFSACSFYSDHSGEAVGDHIPVQSPTVANGLYARVDGRVLAAGHDHIGRSSVQHPLFQVTRSLSSLRRPELIAPET